MPLNKSKSKKAFKDNAISYAVKGEKKKKKK